MTSLAVGSAAVLPLVPVREFGRRFFVLMSLISVVLIVLATVDRGLEISYWHFACAALLVAYNVVLPKQPGIDPIARGTEDSPTARKVLSVFAGVCLFAAILCGGVGVALDAAAVARQSVPNESELIATAGTGILVANALASSLLLGASLVAMVLGHWYLVSRKLSFAPLRYLTMALGVALVVRLGAGAWAILDQREFWDVYVGSVGTMKFFVSDGVFVLSRVVFGTLAPAVLTPLVWRCVKIESNQSATGILYVIVAFVVFGEILAKHFLVNLHLVT